MELKTTEEFVITKEQILELSETNAVIKERLVEWFPKAFKTELEVGKWYKHEVDGDLFCITDITKDAVYGYGFRDNGDWFISGKGEMRCACNSFHFEYLSPASNEEIESALIAEAKKRGFKPNNFKCLVERECEFNKNTHEWSFQQNGLFTAPFGKGGSCLFQDGIWAEILPEQKTIITHEKALKIIAKKLKVSPESIEIK